MGWCSATEILDSTVREVERQYKFLRELEVLVWKGSMDVLLRPLVASLAEQLREGDWDCEQESEYFDRFPQEILGHTDEEHLKWLREQVAEWAEDGDMQQVQKWLARVHAAEAKQSQPTEKLPLEVEQKPVDG